MNKKKFRNFKIGKKLKLGFGILLCTTVILMLCTLFALNYVGKISNRMYEGPYVAAREAMKIQQELNILEKDVRNAILSQELSRYQTKMEEIQTSIQSRIELLQQVFDGDTQLLTDLKDAMVELNLEREKIIGYIAKNDYNLATDNVLGRYYVVSAVAIKYADTLYQDADLLAGQFDTQSEQLSFYTQAIVIICLILFILVMSRIIGIITKSITEPLAKVEEAARQMADGNLDVIIDVESEDELGLLANSMQQTITTIAEIINDIRYVLGEMANGNFCITSKSEDTYKGDYQPILVAVQNIRDKLSITIHQINESADQVFTNSSTVFDGSKALSDGTVKQENSIKELAVAIQHISEQIKDNAQNATQFSNQTLEANKEIEGCNQKMQLMMKAMKNISESTVGISNIIMNIEEIASQTNLLSLNVSIEAARAGEAGKGFMVIAGEVRELANKSAKAVQDTETLIKTSLNSVQNGTTIAEETAELLVKIVKNSQNIINYVDNISEASKEQGESIYQINQGMQQISDVITENMTNSIESTSAGEELSNQAHQLKELVSEFKLD